MRVSFVLSENRRARINITDMAIDIFDNAISEIGGGNGDRMDLFAL